ncbi:MAG: KamA family radical SAM protein [Candidatus Anstonellales archaeon]
MSIQLLNTNTDSFWAHISLDQWNDWRWQLKNRIYDYSELCHLIGLREEHLVDIASITKRYPMAVTPYIINEMFKCLQVGDIDGFNILRKIYLPDIKEINSFSDSPIVGTGEDVGSPVSNCYQFFPDRVVIRLTSLCPSMCRYCFVRNKVGPTGKLISNENLEMVIQYIKETSSIRDVIISGGEPLLISDSALESVLKKFRSISHVEILRIDSKAPNSLPQRITPNLVKLLTQFKPIYLNTHIVNPIELTADMISACSLLADAGIILGAHIPLLSGINDSPEIIEKLVLNLLKNRIRPYMLIHYIKTDGADHFATTVEKGIEIIENIWGKVSGLAIPTYVLYLPKGGGKVPLVPQYVLKKEGGKFHLKNFEGKIFQYEVPI